MMWWWIAAAVVLLVIIPLVVVLANRLVRLTGEIHDYARDIFVHVDEIGGNLEVLPGLAETSRLVGSLLSAEGPLEGVREGDA